MLWVILFTTLSSISFAQKNDTFFNTRVYSELRVHGKVDVRLIGGNDLEAFLYKNPHLKGEQFLTELQVADIALTKLLSGVDEYGIEHKGITKAMFEGKYNPDYNDFALAYKGLGTPTIEEIQRDHPRVINSLVKQGVVKPGERPHDSYLQAVYAVHRNKLSNETFGSIADIGTVETMINGKKTEMTAEDIGLRMLMRLRARRFENSYGSAQNTALRYESFFKKLEERSPDLADSLKSEVMTMMHKQSGYGYFSLIDLSPEANFHLQRDYEQNRSEWIKRECC